MCVFYLDCVLFFFFKQKTAYEMRISDWSSDVCSSDLHGDLIGAIRTHRLGLAGLVNLACRNQAKGRFKVRGVVRSEERRVGKECVCRVDLGGRRIIKKKSSSYTYTIISERVLIRVKSDQS